MKLELIKQAQKYLVESPQDYLHDITHHHRVVLIAREILRNIAEKDTINGDLVDVLCWWHDVKIPDLDYGEKRVAWVIADYLAGLVFEEERELVRDSIKNHEFGSQPNFLEGKVLQDADKLEFLSEERLQNALDALDAGLMKQEEAKLAASNLKKFLPKLPDLYNFSWSKEEHNRRLSKVGPLFDKYFTRFS